MLRFSGGLAIPGAPPTSAVAEEWCFCREWDDSDVCMYVSVYIYTYIIYIYTYEYD